MNKSLKYAFCNSIGTFLYILLIASFMNFMGKNTVDETILSPLAALMLFVFSAAITGGLILGRPILWYIDGNKKEALNLFIYTLSIFLLLLLLVFFALILV